MKNLAFILISIVVNLVSVLLTTAIAFGIFYLINKNHVVIDNQTINKVLNLLSIFESSLYFFAIGIIPAYFVNLKILHVLNHKKNWQLAENILYLAPIIVFVLPLILIYILNTIP